MIIGATRVKTTSGHQFTGDHVWRGADNAEVVTLQGSEADLEDMVGIARRVGRTYAIRHYNLSPGEPVSAEQVRQVVASLAKEFEFDAEAVVLVRHRKPRRVQHDPIMGGQGFDEHWHVLVPEVDPVTLRVLDSSLMYSRHERLARETELRLSHTIIKGRWNTSVIDALERRGEAGRARLLTAAGIADGPPAYAAYSSAQRRRLERLHAGPRGEALDMPTLVRQVQTAWAAHCNNCAEMDFALRRQGLRLRHTDTPPPPHEADGRPLAPAPVSPITGWVVDAWDGRAREAYVLGALHRLVREPRNRVIDALRSITPRKTVNSPDIAMETRRAPALELEPAVDISLEHLSRALPDTGISDAPTRMVAALPGLSV